MVWSPLFGENEVWARTPSLIFGIVSIILTFRLARIHCSERAALLAALFMCFSPVHIWYSQEGTPYAMASILVLSAALTFDRLTREPERKWLYAAYLFFIWASVFTHYYCFSFVCSLTAMSLFMEKRTRNRVMRIHAFVTFCFVVVLGVKYFYGSLISGQGFLRPFTFEQLWMLFFHWFLHGNSLWTVSPYSRSVSFLLTHPLLVAIQLIAAAIFINGLCQLSREFRGSNSLLFLCSFASPLAGLFVLNLIGFEHWYIERYVFETFPFFCIVLAHGATSLAQKPVRYLATLFVLVIAVVSYPAYVQKNRDVWTVYKPNPDWRSAAEFLVGQDGSDERVHVFTGTLNTGLRYYLRRLAAKERFVLERFDPDTPARIRAIMKEERIYLVRNLFWLGPYESTFQERIVL